MNKFQKKLLTLCPGLFKIISDEANSPPKPVPWPAHIHLTHRQRSALMERYSAHIDFEAQICLDADHGYVEFASPEEPKPLLTLAAGKCKWGS